MIKGEYIMKNRRPPPSCTVEVEHNGTRHRGEYTVTGGIVSVTYGMATRSDLSRGHLAEIEARRLLLEILQGNKWQF